MGLFSCSLLWRSITKFGNNGFHSPIDEWRLINNLHRARLQFPG